MKPYGLVALFTACVGHARRVLTSTPQTQSALGSAVPGDVDATVKALSQFLLTSAPADAFSSPAAARGALSRSHSRGNSKMALADPEDLQPASDTSRRDLLKSAASAAALAVGAGTGAIPLEASADETLGVFPVPDLAPIAPNFRGEERQWFPVKLPFVGDTPPILFDMEFSDVDPNLGWIVGNRGTFFETRDAGVTWKPKQFDDIDPDDETNYRYTNIAFKGDEGWIIGKPALLLHTKDRGKSWERIPLNPKFPGDPTMIIPLGPGVAEMATSQGGIYRTDNTAQNFIAQVRETIDATLNRVSSAGVEGASYYSGTVNSIQRDKDGAYLAVGSRGNFYLTWKPGDNYWVPHNRETSRRIISMGFQENSLASGLWMTLAGGDISRTVGEIDTTKENIPFKRANMRAAGYGILDIGFGSDQRIWAVGGSGAIFRSDDKAETFRKDRSARCSDQLVQD